MPRRIVPGMTTLTSWLCMLMLLGCGDDDNAGDNNNANINNGNDNGNLNANDNTNLNNNSVQLDPITPGGCGLPEYQWLPTDNMGTIISYEEESMSPFTAANIDSVLVSVNAALVPVPYGVRLFRIRYTTQDKGQQVEATAMVGIPWNEDDPPMALPTALWLHGTTGFTSACAPSDMGLNEVVKVAIFAAHGYVTAAPDYIGLDPEAPMPPDVTHAYMGIEQTGIGSLDALRATYSLVNDELATKITASDEVVLWGVSQGGHAAFSCNLLAPYYAPEFDIRAMVASVPGSDPLALIAYGVSEMSYATAYSAAAMTTYHAWYEGTAPLTDVFTDDASTLYASEWTQQVFTSCGAAGVAASATEVEAIFTQSFIDDASGLPDESWAPWYCYLADNTIATARIPLYNDTPTLFIVGENDTIVSPTVARADFDRLCGMGYSLDYLECAGADHMDTALWSLVDQHDWVRDRLDGVPLDTTSLCQQSSPVTCSGQP